MKRRISRPVLAALLFVAYLLGVLLGMFVILYIPIMNRQGPEMLETVRQIAEEYPEGSMNTANRWMGRGLRIVIYDNGGDCVFFSSVAGGNINEMLDELLRSLLGSVQSGASVFRVIPAQEPSRNPTRFWLLSGAPVPGGGGAFLVKNLENVQEAFLGYLIYFTVFYWLSVFLLLTYLRKKRKMEISQRNYIANVTHALKSPIAAIQALTEALSDTVPPDSDQQRVYYGMILRETGVQSRMVQEILTLSKLQNADMDLTKATVDAGEIFAELREKYEVLCDCASIDFRITEAALCLPPLNTNASCLGQLLEILMDNALKFVDEGGEIVIDAAVSRRRATVCVRDNGIGISKEDLPHVFERFYKAGGRRNESGSGLGLAIAWEIAAGLKEKIWVESEPGRGTAFFFTVQLQ